MASTELLACMCERQLWKQQKKAATASYALDASYSAVSFNSTVQGQSPDFCDPSSAHDFVSTFSSSILSLFLLKMPSNSYFFLFPELNHDHNSESEL